MKDGIIRVFNGTRKPRSPLEGQFISWIKGKEGKMIYREFCYFADKIARRRDNYSADAIMHTVRTNAVIGGHKGAKVNNNFVAYAARLYSEQNPDRATLFKTRQLKA